MTAALSIAERLARVFTPAHARAASEALDTLASEIRASLAEGLDHTVAHTRLVWWREEVSRLSAGAPLHPVSRALMTAAPRARYHLIDSLITACEFVLAGHQPSDEGERAALYRRMYGAVETVRCEIIQGGPEPTLEAYATQLALVLGHADRVECSLFEARRAATEALKAALLSLNDTFTGLPAERHGLVIAGLLAHRLSADGLRPPPAPLRALFMAWRTARRHRLEFA